ncbi:MAG: AraC family transcriptional regulator [Peptococcaceae bacterium]|nr:AraC family transcriptional regulator [Peptococcaceae bacterium]
MTGAAMNSIYQSLAANSPRSMVVEIPEMLGRGRITQVTTKQGAVLSDWQMAYFSDLHVQGESAADYIQLLFCLAEGVDWQIAGEGKAVHLGRGESCIYRGHGKIESLCYGGKREFLFKNIKLPVAYFSRILAEYFDAREAAIYEARLYSGIEKIALTPYMTHIFAELEDFSRYQGGLGHLYLESKIFELLSVYLSEVLCYRILDDSGGHLARGDRDAIAEAKRLIDSQLAYAPSVEALAHQVGISTSKLGKGFSAMYGTSVHAYIIDKRLAMAASLLMEGRLNVSEVAALVGYAKASNFSAAFKRKYGVVPKNYRAEKSLH